jgi:hypothetical protein
MDMMYHCPLHGSLGDLFLEGSVQQFVALHLAPFVQPQTPANTISRRDRETIML